MYLRKKAVLMPLVSSILVQKERETEEEMSDNWD